MRTITQLNVQADEHNFQVSTIEYGIEEGGVYVSHETQVHFVTHEEAFDYYLNQVGYAAVSYGSGQASTQLDGNVARVTAPHSSTEWELILRAV